MNDSKAQVNLCTFSVSTVLADRVLPSCPIDLTRALAKKCPCRKRVSHVTAYDLRVLTCTHPDRWNGQPLEDTEIATLKAKVESRPRKKRSRQIMTDEATAVATATETDESNGNQLVPIESGHGGVLTLGQQEAVSNAVAIWDRIENPMDAIEKIGAAFYASKMFGCREPAQGTILAMACFCERKTPFEIIRTYDIIGGRLSMKAGSMLAQFEQVGGEFEIVERSSERAAIKLTLKRGRGKAREYLSEVTWNDIKGEAFTKDSDGNLKPTYATPRGRMQMLWARAISDGVGAIAPRVKAGYYTPEEVADFTETNLPALSVEGEQRRRDLQSRIEAQRQQSTVAATQNAKAGPASDAQSAIDVPSKPAPEAPQPPAQQPAAEAAQQTSDPPITEHEIQNLRSWKESINPAPEVWQQLLAKAGVTSATQLTHSGYLRFVTWFEKRKAEKDAADAAAGRQKTEEESWAEGALGPSAPNP